jgi:hypothetical protein
MEQIFVRCSLDGHENQKYCGLVEHYKAIGDTNQCPHQQECSDLKTYVNNEEGILNEIK